MITRVFTDVPPGALQMMANTIAADNGTFTQEPQDDGNFTLYAEFPGDPPPEQPSARGASAFPWMAIAEGEIGVAAGQAGASGRARRLWARRVVERRLPSQRDGARRI